MAPGDKHDDDFNNSKKKYNNDIVENNTIKKEKNTFNDKIQELINRIETKKQRKINKKNKETKLALFLFAIFFVILSFNSNHQKVKSTSENNHTNPSVPKQEYDMVNIYDIPLRDISQLDFIACRNGICKIPKKIANDFPIFCDGSSPNCRPGN